MAAIYIKDPQWHFHNSSMETMLTVFLGFSIRFVLVSGDKSQLKLMTVYYSPFNKFISHVLIAP
jgi:hypothetical protein